MNREQYKLDWKDYYAILSVPTGCETDHIIKNNYRALMRDIAHPDKNPELGQEVAKDINLAYEYLSDPVKRANYYLYYKEREQKQEQQQTEAAWQQQEAERLRKQVEEATERAEIAERQQKEAIRRAHEAEQFSQRTREAPGTANNQQLLIEKIRADFQESRRQSELAAQRRLSMLTDEERREEERKKEAYWKASRKRERIKKYTKPIGKGFKYVLIAPLTIASKGISAITKIIGIVSAIGIPYGVYCVYKIITQLNESIPLSETTHKWGVGLFFVLPFAAFLIHYLTKKLSEFFDGQLRRLKWQ